MVLAFSDFELDLTLNELRHDGGTVSTQPLVFDLLVYLVHSRGRVVSKEDLLKYVWKGAIVGDGAITQAISLLRHALLDSASPHRIIQTVRGHGYRFVPEVRSVSTSTEKGEVGQEPSAWIRPPFAGRNGAIRILCRALEDALAGESRLVFLCGEPGIGKTRTCMEFAQLAKRYGVDAFLSPVIEDEGAPSFRPWARLVHEAREETSEAAPINGNGRAKGTGASSGRIAPLGVRLRKARSGLSERSRFDLFERVAQLWISRSEKRPLLLVLDDLHRADIPSLRLLEHVVREARTARILFVGTFREAEIRESEERSHSIGGFARRDNTVVEKLTRLTPADLEDLLNAMQVDNGDPNLVAWLHEKSGGNPLLLKELLRLWKRRGASWSNNPQELPVGMLLAIRRHLDIVSPECHRLLSTASVLGREFDVPVLAGVSDQPTELALAQIDEAVRAEILVRSAPYRLQFAHALIRDALYETLSGERKIELHARMATAV